MVKALDSFNATNDNYLSDIEAAISKAIENKMYQCTIDFEIPKSVRKKLEDDGYFVCWRDISWDFNPK